MRKSIAIVVLTIIMLQVCAGSTVFAQEPVYNPPVYQNPYGINTVEGLGYELRHSWDKSMYDVNYAINRASPNNNVGKQWQGVRNTWGYANTQAQQAGGWFSFEGFDSGAVQQAQQWAGQ